MRARETVRKVIDIIRKPEMRILPGQLAFFLVLSLIPLLALVGAIGWLVYLLVVNKGGVVWATFFASLVIDICAQILARVMKTPVTIFLIGGILPLVPGSHIYRTIR